MSAHLEQARISVGAFLLTGLIHCIGTSVFGEDIIVHPETTNAHLRNPGMGFTYPAVQQPIPETTAGVRAIWIKS
jgi:hypothetical protein